MQALHSHCNIGRSWSHQNELRRASTCLTHKQWHRSVTRSCCIAASSHQQSAQAVQIEISSQWPVSTNTHSSRRLLLLAGACAMAVTKPVWAEDEALDASPAVDAETQDAPPTEIDPLTNPSTTGNNNNSSTSSQPPVSSEPPPAAFIYSFQSEVPPNLRVLEYVNIIKRSRPACWQRIAQRLQAGEYVALSEDLNQDGFADLRQASLYIPWALMQREDFTKAIEARKGYNDFESHVLDLQAASIAAASGDGDAQRVQQAFFLMSASLDSYLALIPTVFLGVLQN